MELQLVRLSTEAQMLMWKAAFETHDMIRPEEYYSECLAENETGHRVTLLALVNGELAGCAHLKFNSSYEYFHAQSIPEINDLNVFPQYRRQGIANKMMDELETLASLHHPVIGIGVGLYSDYGAAQRIYCRRGYIPDGQGVAYNNQIVEPGGMVYVDDDLVLYFTKPCSPLHNNQVLV